MADDYGHAPARDTFGRTPATRRNLLRFGAATVATGMAAAYLRPDSPVIAAGTDSDQIEPSAGSWKTWVLGSGSELRPPPPPDQAATATEIQTLKMLATQRDAAARDQIAFWDAGSPSYRWVNLTLDQIVKKPLSNPRNARLLSLVNVAMYDAIVAAWDAKYAYNRLRPSQTDGTLDAALPNPASPSYPSEHAVVAGAASTVLAYVYPDDAQSFTDQAKAAGQSRLLAGVQFPSDVQAGLDLGRAVGARIVERAKNDGSDAKWTGSVPSEPGHWNGTNPAEPLAGTWKPWTLAAGNQFRLDAPPAYGSPQEATDLAEVKTFTRTFDTNAKAFYWNTVPGIFSYWYETASRYLFEHRLADNAPRAARAYALMSVTFYDALIAVWDTKYTYWAPRPVMLDPDVKPIFPTPSHPSYPSADSAVLTGIATVMGELFPSDAAAFAAKGQEAAISRLWAGIHFRSDIEAGAKLGPAVARQVIERAKQDGSA